MMYQLIMYDISNNRIRTRLYKGLLKMGAFPLQKSILLLNVNNNNKRYPIVWIENEILKHLEVNDQVHSLLLTNVMVQNIVALKSNIPLEILDNNNDMFYI